MKARIYQPARSAMQSGMATSSKWVLEFSPIAPRVTDPLMGWTSSTDTLSQVRLSFDTKQDAVKFAQTKGIQFTVQEPKRRKPLVRQRGYAENFAFDRKAPWTH